MRVFGRPGEHSPWIDPAEFARGDADVVLVFPCGFSIERTLAEFMKVASMPAPAPRCEGGREFITPALFGEAKRPMPIPFSSRITANQP